MTKETILEVVLTLTGNVRPIGETHADAARLENLEKFIYVFNEMHMIIDGVATDFENSNQHSEKLLGQRAAKHIESMGIE